MIKTHLFAIVINNDSTLQYIYYIFNIMTIIDLEPTQQKDEMYFRHKMKQLSYTSPRACLLDGDRTMNSEIPGIHESTALTTVL